MQALQALQGKQCAGFASCAVQSQQLEEASWLIQFDHLAWGSPSGVMLTREPVFSGESFVYCATICSMPSKFTSVLICQATPNHLRCHVTPQESGLHKPLHVYEAAAKSVILPCFANEVPQQNSGSNSSSWQRRRQCPQHCMAYTQFPTVTHTMPLFNDADGCKSRITQGTLPFS